MTEAYFWIWCLFCCYKVLVILGFVNVRWIIPGLVIVNRTIEGMAKLKVQTKILFEKKVALRHIKVYFRLLVVV